MVHQSLERAARRRDGATGLSTTRRKHDAEISRVLRRLADLVEDSDLRRREIETRAGFRKGYLAQLLCSRVELKVWHVVALLDALGVNAGEFFAALYPRRRLPFSPTVVAGLRINADVICIYSLGIEAVEQMRARLAVCERELRGWLAEQSQPEEG